MMVSSDVMLICPQHVLRMRNMRATFRLLLLAAKLHLIPSCKFDKVLRVEALDWVERQEHFLAFQNSLFFYSAKMNEHISFISNHIVLNCNTYMLNNHFINIYINVLLLQQMCCGTPSLFSLAVSKGVQFLDCFLYICITSFVTFHLHILCLFMEALIYLISVCKLRHFKYCQHSCCLFTSLYSEASTGLV